MDKETREYIEDLELQVSYMQEILLRHFPGCFDDYHARKAANNDNDKEEHDND